MNLLRNLPADGKLSVTARSKFLAAVREGEEQADRGEVVPHERLKREFKSWIEK